VTAPCRAAGGAAPRPVVASGKMSVPRSVRPCLAALLIVLVVAGCGYVESAEPSPTPADFQGIAAEFAKRGLEIDHAVSGDTGCTDTVLRPTAISFDGSGLDQATPVRIYLYVFRDRATFQRLSASVDACARTYVSDPATYGSVDQSPYVLAGQGPWAPKFEAALRAGLLVAAGTGDNAGSNYP
jgi:hypothetical protein